MNYSRSQSSCEANFKTFCDREQSPSESGPGLLRGDKLSGLDPESFFIAHEVREDSSGTEALVSPVTQQGHIRGGLTRLLLAGFGARIERGSTSPQIPSLPKGSFSRGEGLQDDRCPTRKGSPCWRRPGVRKLSVLVALQFVLQHTEISSSGFLCPLLTISCNPSVYPPVIILCEFQTGIIGF